MPKKSKKFPKEVELDLMKQAARLLLAGNSLNAAAEKLQVSRFTIWRWRKDPRYQKIMSDIQNRLTAQADDALLKTVVGKLQFGAEKALDYEIGLLDDPEVSATVKQRVAADLMDRDERMQKKRTVTAKQTHDVIPAEILALAAATAQALRGAPLRALPAADEGPIIEAELTGID